MRQCLLNEKAGHHPGASGTSRWLLYYLNTGVALTQGAALTRALLIGN